MPGRVRRREEPPWLRHRAPRQEGERQKLEGGTELLVLPEGGLGERVAGGTEPRVHTEPWRRKGDLGVESRTFLG